MRFPRASIVLCALALAVLLAAPGSSPLDHAHAQDGGVPIPVAGPRATPVAVDARTLPPGGPAGGAQRARLHPAGDEDLARGKAAGAPGVSGGAAPPAGPLAPVPGIGFEGISSAQSSCGCYPPDGAVAVSPTHVVGAVNTAFAVWDKGGSLAAGFPKSLSSLFSSNTECLSGISDPFAEYDVAAARFMVGALTYDANNNSAVCVAVTQGYDPTATWLVYGFAVTPANDLFDFPHATIGSDAIFVTGNQFQDGTTFTGARIYAYDKFAMYAGAPAASVFVDVGNNAAGKLADTLTPARGVMAPGVAYFIAADNDACPCSNVSLWKWTDALGASSFTLQGGVTVTSYQQPPNAAQRGGHGVPGLISTNDAGNLGGYFYNGTVYGAHTVAVNPGGGTVAGVQWYQLGNADGAPSLLQQGIVAADGQYRFFPNLSVDGQGNMTLAYAYSSSADYAGVRYTGRLASDAVGVLQSEATLKAGEQTANGGRWGDYAGAAVDPDGCTVWHLEEYAKSGLLWGTWVGSMRASTCAPASVGGIAEQPDVSSLPVTAARPGDRALALVLGVAAVGFLAAAGAAASYARRRRIT